MPMLAHMRQWLCHPILIRSMAVAFTGLLWFLTGGPIQAASLLAAHKASYSLAMHRASVASDVAAVNGRLEVTFEASCDGWKAEQFLGFALFSQEGELLEHLAHISSFETLDGSEFIFTTKAFEDRELSEELSGTARRKTQPPRVQVRYILPKRQSEELTGDTLFPGQHAKKILVAARAGKKHMMSTVFDGSTEDNPFEISTFLGNPRVDTDNRFKALREHTLWPVRLAYYKLNATTPAPDFEMSIELYDHGIAGDMLYDYGNFSVDVVLEDVQLLPMPNCPD